MTFDSKLNELIASRQVAEVLKKGCADQDLMKVFHKGLRDLGFAAELEWADAEIAAVYGDNTAAAVKAFASLNGLSDRNGEVVDEALAKQLAFRYDQLDDLRLLLNAVQTNATLDILYKGSPHKVAVTVLQNILYYLGYEKELNWAKYGADGGYGGSTVAAVKAFTAKVGIASTGEKVTPAIAKAGLDELTHYFGKSWADDYAPAPSEHLIINESVEKSRARVIVSDGISTISFSKFKLGIWTTGQHTAADFVAKNPALLEKLGLSQSEVNILNAVSENEGNLDAINTWDNSFMTFGMFQWTVGADSAKGELAGLINNLKKVNIDIFNHYFGRHGLDVAEMSGNNGFFSLHGEVLRTPAQKEKLRTYEWAFYFWKAGQDDAVKAVELSLAASRIGVFYQSKNYKVGEYFISDLITSEYGIALLVDNHVNRPGYITSCLKGAFAKSGLTSLPSAWTTEDEMHLIDLYLTVRATYGSSPMTDAIKRGQVTKKYTADGRISIERNSYKPKVAVVA